MPHPASRPRSRLPVTIGNCDSNSSRVRTSYRVSRLACFRPSWERKASRLRLQLRLEYDARREALYGRMCLCRPLFPCWGCCLQAPARAPGFQGDKGASSCRCLRTSLGLQAVPRVPMRCEHATSLANAVGYAAYYEDQTLAFLRFCPHAEI